MKKLLLLLIIPLFFSCKKDLNISIQDTGTLPKLEITIDEYYLWSPDSGLYVVGEHLPNWNQNFEHPGKIKYSENNYTLFEEEVGIRIKGNRTRGWAMKSFGFYFRNEYGTSELQYPVFTESSLNVYKRLVARNSGNDFGITQIHDISVASIVRGHVNFEFQEYNQCVVYLNDVYWGIYNLREMITPHHFENHFGFPKENIDLLEGSELYPIADDGNINNYMDNVLNYINNNDLSLQDNYNHIKNIIDIESYVDYIIVNTYINNVDWPHHNIKWWKDRTTEESKWRWVMYDTDSSFTGVESVWIGDLIGERYNDEGSFYIFNKLIKNQEFKEFFLNRYLYIIENVFNKDRVETLILNNKNRIDDEYDNFHIKWPGTNNKFQWEQAVYDLIKFNNQRYDVMKNIIETLKNDFENENN